MTDEEIKTLTGVVEFLKTKRPVSEIAIALDVIKEFRALEGAKDWLSVPFLAWAKLEQLQDYCTMLTGGECDERDDIAPRYLALHRAA